MEKEVAQKLKIIDNEISNALNAITDLESRLAVARTDDEGNVLKEECITLKEKFSSFNKSINELTKMLIDLGIISEDEV